MTMKTRSASRVEKGTTILSPNGKTKDRLAEQNKDIEESDVKAEAALNIEGMLRKVKDEKYPPLPQKYKDRELTREEVERGVNKIQSTTVMMAEEMQSITDTVDENAKTQQKDLETLKN